MSRPLVSLRAAALAAGLLGAAVAAHPAVAAPLAVAAPAQAQQQLDRLADAFYVARAKFDPLLFATANGDSRYDDQLGKTIWPAARAKQFALYHEMQKQLKALARAQLPAKAQLNYDLLAFEVDSALDLEHFPEHLLPLNQFDNVPSTLANYASGTGSQPLATPKQYRAYLGRLQQLPAWIDQAVANMREGIKVGVVQPKAITVAMLPQFQQLRSATPEASIFYTPIKNLPAQFSDKDKQQLTAAYRAAAAKIGPALDRLCRFLETDYLAASRASTGLGDLPNGAAWYQARIHNNTTLSLTPAQIHELGLKEVARIQQQLAALGPKLGYDGPPAQLPQWVGAQAKFKPFRSDAQVLDAYRTIYGTVSAKLPTYFSLLPKAKLDIQLEPELTRATASDHYTPVAADGSHPGVFWVVVNDPKQYSNVSMASLFLHEGVPGHHLHAALLKEIGLPDFRKFNTENPTSAAYTEGWALYSETLGKEFGLYDQPAAWYGHLNDELLRAVRLVVDTGMHAQGWSHEKAIAYMMDVLGYSKGRATNQVERYMVWPAQALSYKLGAMKILELRARAQQALGAKFSYPAFHAVVLGDGTLSLPILEAQVDRWIASAKPVAQRWELGPAGRWDYTDVDPVRHRLFLSRGDRVHVLGLPSGETVGEIANTAGVHGVAFAQDLKLGFTSNGRSNSVTVFDLDTLQVKQEIKVSGINPDTIVYDQHSHKLYTFNGKSADVSVIDAASLKPVATIKLDGRPEFAATDNAGRIYLNIEDKSELAVIDVAGDKLVAQWPLQGCEEPTGLALDAANARVFSVCQNKIMAVSDARTGRRITDVAIGAHPDAALYDAASKTVFSSNGEGSLTVIRQVDPDHYSAATVPTEKGARTMAFDPAANRIYLPAAVDKVFTVLVVAP